MRMDKYLKMSRHDAAFNAGCMEQRLEMLNASIKELESMNASLKTEMAWSAEAIAEWGAYANERFQNKYDLAGDVARAKRASEIGGV